MQYDIIPISETEVGQLNTDQLRLLRDAQLKKNTLKRNAESELKEFELAVMSKGLKYSSLVESKRIELENEVKYRCSVIADNLLFGISVIGQKDDGASNIQTGYRVDYSLSYSDRYVIVRNYYLKITDVNERMTKYAADEVAKKYLGTYYKTLYNVLATY